MLHTMVVGLKTAPIDPLRDSGLDDGRDNSVEIERLHIEAFGRAAQKDRQRVARFTLLFLQRRNRGFLRCDLGPLLRQFEVRRYAVRHLRFGDRQYSSRSLDVLFGDRDALTKRQDVEIRVGDARRNGEIDGLLGIACRQFGLFGRAQLVAIETPQIDFVARLGRHAERVVRVASRHALLVGAVALRGSGRIDIREECRACDAGLCLGLDDARGGRQQIEVLFPCRCFERRQLGSIQGGPPIERGPRGRVLCDGRGKCRRDVAVFQGDWRGRRARSRGNRQRDDRCRAQQEFHEIYLRQRPAGSTT